MRFGCSLCRLLAGFACAFLGTGAGLLHAQPFGYTVNAADPTSNGTHDNLWRINLATGVTERIGPLNIPNAANPQSDVEGLALETATFLYGVDDATDSLLVINTSTGTAQALDRPLDNLRLGLGGQPLDPGLVFDCAGRLLMSSASRRSLYRLNKLTGQATVIGGEGRLAVNIGDIAVRGDDLLGIGINGDEGLYRISAEDGSAELIGAFDKSIRLAAAGLSFDASGNLWAIGHVVDNGQPQPSRVLRIDPVTGVATPGAVADRIGLKSLAITQTRCPTGGGPPPAPPAVAAPVDSPWALAALLLALLGLAWHQRARFDA